MVLIKAAFNREIRKLAVGTDIVYSELVQKLIGVFPSLKGVKESNVRLFYKDADGDQIRFCSDEELRTALQCVGDDNTLRILIGVEEEKRQEEPTTQVLLLDTDDFFNEPFGHAFPSLLESLGHHHHHHFGPIGGFFRQQALREREEQLRQQRLYEEKVRKAELERRKALMKKVKQAREEKMKQLAEARRKSQEVSCTSSNKPLIPEFPPGWMVTPFGSWEPAVHEDPNFTQWSWGPYGYHATYGSSSESAESEKKAETAQNGEKMDDQPSQE